MTRSQKDLMAAVALLTTGCLALPGAEAAGRKHRAPAQAYKRTVSQHAVRLSQDPDMVAALASTVESLDPAFLTQPIAVIGTRSNGLVQVIVETPPRGALAGYGKPVRLATASYHGDNGAIETHAETAPEVSGKLDLSLPLVGGTAIEQLAAAGTLTTAFVLVVQPANNGYNVIFSPIPYVASQLKVITVTTVVPNYANPAIVTPSPNTPALPPADGSAPPGQPGNS